MLPIIKYKILLFTNAVTTLTLNSLIICLGVLDAYADIRGHIRSKENHLVDEHETIALGIFFLGNISIFIHISLVSIRALKGLNVNWEVGCHYFFAVVGQLMSAIVLFTYYSYLHYPIGLVSLAVAQSVCIFFLVLSAQRIFDEVVSLTEAKEINELYKDVNVATKRILRKQKSQCVTVNIGGSPAGPSR